MINFSVSIPLYPILVVAGICGVLAGWLVSFFAWRSIMDLDRARFSYLVNEIKELRRRNNDWEDTEGNPYATHWYDRLIRSFYDRRSDRRKRIEEEEA